MNAKQQAEERLDEALSAALHAQLVVEASLEALCATRGLSIDAELRRRSAMEERDRWALSLGLSVLACLRERVPVVLDFEAEDPTEAKVELVVDGEDRVEVELPAEPEPVAAPPFALPVPAPAAAPAPAVAVEGLRTRLPQAVPDPTLLADGARLADAEAFVQEMGALMVNVPGAVARLGRLQLLVSDLRRLDPLPTHRRHKAVQALVFEARALQDEARPRLPASDKDVLRGLFGRVASYTEDSRLPFVHGLSRNAAPRKGSWSAAASLALRELCPLPTDGGKSVLQRLRADLEQGGVSATEIPGRFEAVVRAGISSSDPELVELAFVHKDALLASSMNKTLRNKLKRLRTRPNPLPAPAAKPPAAPVHVAARKLLEGRRGVIIGGDARGQAQERIDEAFGLESLEWEHGNGQRRVQALAKRVESGKIDCLIFLRRFISHRLNDLLLKAADKAGALILWVDQGYGVTQVEQAALRVAGSAAAAR